MSDRNIESSWADLFWTFQRTIMENSDLDSPDDFKLYLKTVGTYTQNIAQHPAVKPTYRLAVERAASALEKDTDPSLSDRLLRQLFEVIDTDVTRGGMVLSALSENAQKLSEAERTKTLAYVEAYSSVEETPLRRMRTIQKGPRKESTAQEVAPSRQETVQEKAPRRIPARGGITPGF